MPVESLDGLPADDRRLSTLLREWRERALLTREQLAERAGLNVRTIGRLERGAPVRPRSASVRLLAEALRLDAAERAVLIAATRGGQDGDGYDQPGPPPPVWRQTATAAHRHLPADVAFIGRAHELATLDSVLDGDGVVVVAIDGMAGVGKTALAVHAAHQLAPQFPDGQLFIDLHGYAHGMTPVEPGEALDRMLRALGVPGEQIPQHLDDRAALYRGRLAGKYMLIVLDNAATYDQVVPLIPGTPGCLVLITSRRRLTGLDPTHTVSLDVLPPADAVSLFVRAAGAQRTTDAAPPVLNELVELCGRLPLAVRVAAARLRSHLAWSVPHLVARLREQKYRLAELESGRRSVATALELSYQELTGDLRRAYRLLGLHPGTDIDHYAAAALVDMTPIQARRLLDELFDAHLLHEPTLGRYRFHELIQAHAAESAARDETGTEREAALGRLFDHYSHTATIAMDLLDPDNGEERPRGRFDGTTAPPLNDAAHAAAWLEADLPNLLAAAQRAVDAWPGHTIHLSATLHRHLRAFGQYTDAVALHNQALSAAIATGDRIGQVRALTDLGHIHRRQGRQEAAAEDFTQALEIACATGDVAGQAAALNGLGWLRLRQGRHDEATSHFGQALEITRVAGTSASRLAELKPMVGLSTIDRLRGRYAEATDSYQQVLDLARATGHRIAELNGMIGLADIYRIRGQYDQAATSYQQVLDLARRIGDRNWRFEAAHGLGRLHHAAGQPDPALTYHRQALDLAAGLGHIEDIARAHDGIAHAHCALKQYEQARAHWQQALDIFTRLGAGCTEDEEATAATIQAQLARLDQSAAGAAQR